MVENEALIIAISYAEISKQGTPRKIEDAAEVKLGFSTMTAAVPGRPVARIASFAGFVDLVALFHTRLLITFEQKPRARHPHQLFLQDLRMLFSFHRCDRVSPPIPCQILCSSTARDSL